MSVSSTCTPESWSKEQFLNQVRSDLSAIFTSSPRHSGEVNDLRKEDCKQGGASVRRLCVRSSLSSIATQQRGDFLTAGTRSAL